MSSSAIKSVVIAVSKKPTLWPVALKQLWRIRKSNWYTEPPFLPIPEKSYIDFRINTAYGSSEDFSQADLERAKKKLWDKSITLRTLIVINYLYAK